MALDMFMKIATVPGESKDKTHPGEIDVLSWSWGATQSGSTHTGTGGGAGKANFHDIAFTHYIDKGSPVLLQKLAKGTHIADAILTVRKAGDTPIEYLKITMSEVIVSSIATGGSGGEDRLTESVTLNFAKFDVEYSQQKDAGGGAEAPVVAKWNIATNAET